MDDVKKVLLLSIRLCQKCRAHRCHGRSREKLEPERTPEAKHWVVPFCINRAREEEARFRPQGVTVPAHISPHVQSLDDALTLVVWLRASSMEGAPVGKHDGLI